jgi:UDP-glucose 4-epimerase
MKINGKRIFISGGSGYLGKNLIRRYYSENEITVYSRDEAKHYYLKKEFPKVRCIIGDVRNFDLLKRSSIKHDIGIFAASMKQIEAVDQNYEEGIQTIIHGAINSRRVAEENEMEAACFISSDKSRAATTLYGSMKFVGGELFIVNSDKSIPKLSSAIYGNVLNSTGSVIPLIWDAIKKNYRLTLYSKEMTRFMITVDQAIDLIECSLDLSGFNVIPNIRSFKILDLFEIYRDSYGLKFDIGNPRISEKIHEMMFSSEESPRVRMHAGNYIMHYKDVYGEDLPFKEFTSDKVLIEKNELNSILKIHNYFMP